MKSSIEIDGEQGTITVSFVIARPEDAEHAAVIVRNAAAMVWPEEIAPRPALLAPPSPAKGGERDFSKPPKPGSVSEKILQAAERLGTDDAVAIADDLDLTTGVAAMAIARLKKGGHL